MRNQEEIMKKYLALILALVMALTLVACGPKPADDAPAASGKLVVLEENLGSEQYGIAFRNGEDDVCKAMESAVAKLVADGTYAKIAEKYPDISPNGLTLLSNPPAVEDVEVEARTFIMGIDAEYPPFSYMDENGEYTGFDVEVCKAACDLLGWDFEVFGVVWDNKLVQLDAKECDCIWSGMTILDSMKEAGYVISAPYFDNTQVIVTKEDSGIKSSADLAGKVVAVQLGTSGEALLAEGGDQAELAATFGDLVTCDSFLKCFTELEGNAVDAVIVDKPVADSYVNK